MSHSANASLDSVAPQSPTVQIAENTPPVSEVVAKTPPRRFAPHKKVADPFAAQLQPKNARWKWGLGILAALVVGLGTLGGAYASWTNGGRIAANVSVAGENIGGLTQSGAAWRLNHRFGALPLTLTSDAGQNRVKLADLGGQISIAPTVKKAFAIGRGSSLTDNVLRVYGARAQGQRFMLPIEWNKARLVAQLRKLNAKYRVEATNARLKMGVAGLEVVAGRAGREINIGESARLIQAKYFVGAPKIPLQTREIAPKISENSLQGRDVQLANYTTTFNSGLIGRTTNIRVAAATIEGRVLMPGEELSFNQCTGERTWKKGYRMAHIFERKAGATQSEVVDGLAGGVCQVSSTLYNAVRKANQKSEKNPIKIVERISHSLPVTYVPRGLDATVAWPYKDFKFRNASDQPIFLKTQISRRRLTIGVWGRIPN